MLPDTCRWIRSEDGNAYLHWHASCVAIVHADGTVRIQGWGHEAFREYPGRSQSHSMRMVEKWVAHRKCLPGGPSVKRRKALQERLRQPAKPSTLDRLLAPSGILSRPIGREIQKIDYGPDEDADQPVQSV